MAIVFFWQICIVVLLVEIYQSLTFLIYLSNFTSKYKLIVVANKSTIKMYFKKYKINFEL
jgi:hypothetical protein